MTLDTLEIILKLFLACVLGGIIGLERESVNRPAGFRTHILVSIGATIVMITNIELVRIMAESAEVQPGRFGASVISGIGFLGAGTIMKEGMTVKGLTTAASLWATACIGLALGSGLYVISLSATIFVFLTLEFFPKIERKIAKARSITKVKITAKNEIGQLSRISAVFEKLHVNIRGVKTDKNILPDDDIVIMFKLKSPSKLSETTLIKKLMVIDGISEILVDPE
jgi:putative Mg2+ transporter-C (MgtC) family protein